MACQLHKYNLTKSMSDWSQSQRKGCCVSSALVRPSLQVILAGVRLCRGLGLPFVSPWAVAWLRSHWRGHMRIVQLCSRQLCVRLTAVSGFHVLLLSAWSEFFYMESSFLFCAVVMRPELRELTLPSRDMEKESPTSSRKDGWNLHNLAFAHAFVPTR